jgi:hypothetical protein
LLLHCLHRALLLTLLSNVQHSCLRRNVRHGPRFTGRNPTIRRRRVSFLVSQAFEGTWQQAKGEETKGEEAKAGKGWWEGATPVEEIGRCKMGCTTKHVGIDDVSSWMEQRAAEELSTIVRIPIAMSSQDRPSRAHTDVCKEIEALSEKHL